MSLLLGFVGFLVGWVLGVVLAVFLAQTFGNDFGGVLFWGGVGAVLGCGGAIVGIVGGILVGEIFQ